MNKAKCKGMRVMLGQSKEVKCRRNAVYVCNECGHMACLGCGDFHQFMCSECSECYPHIKVMYREIDEQNEL